MDGLSQQEVECGDLESVLLAETKDHADWHVLSQLAEQATGDMKTAVQAAVDEVESQEDEHLEWARDTLSQLTLQMVAQSKAPSPERWQSIITGPVPGIEAFHPAPFTEGLLEGAAEPVWIETPISRSLNATTKPSTRGRPARKKR